MSNVVFLTLAMFAAPQMPVLSMGIHSLTLQRDGSPAIHYAIAIPRGYSSSTRVPLVLALHFAGKYPQRFSAAIPVAGIPPASGLGWKMPVLAIHSRNDEVAPIGPTEQRIKELEKAGVHAQLIALSGITHFQTYRFVDGLKRA